MRILRITNLENRKCIDLELNTAKVILKLLDTKLEHDLGCKVSMKYINVKGGE
jgi:hypothetical protein